MLKQAADGLQSAAVIVDDTIETHKDVDQDSSRVDDDYQTRVIRSSGFARKQRGMVHQNKSAAAAADWGHYSQNSRKAMIIDDDDQENYIQANGQRHVAQDEDVQMIDTASVRNGIAIQDSENHNDINEIGDGIYQIGIEGWEEPDYFESAEEQREIQRLKELRQQKRKLQGSDYIPFDESTSGGIVAHKESRIAQNTSINSIEAQMIQRKLIKDHYACPPKTQPQKMTLKKGIFDMDQQQHRHFEI